MTLPALAIAFLGLLTIAYFRYGGWVARQFSLDDSRPTPAHEKNDGIDYVPTRTFYLFGQHFSAIAAAGPIAGPIVACQAFGWLPCLVWIALGVVLIGAVHDFASLTASVRHGACSIAEITRDTLGPRAGRAMMAFIWIAILYIIVAFADITAGSFVSAIEEIQGVAITFNPGGAVAAASILYLSLSLIMGLTQRFLNPPLWLLTVVFVPLAFLSSWMGTQISEYFLFSSQTWCLLIIAYCALGSIAPVWLLLQPRGFLGGFILYFALAVGTIGILFGGYTIQQPAVTSWDIGGATGSLFPFLFVTIACGACSGFHGLVCSGTTSKQVDKESDMHTVGYGAMLAEAFVAFIALAVVMIMSRQEIAGLKPGTIYGHGIGRFLTLIIGKDKLPLAITLGAMAFSTFVFDTLDVTARLGRYLFQELTGWKGWRGALLGTVLTLGLPATILLLAPEGAWLRFWTLFGASNQLLAALTLLSITLWLRKARRRIAFTLLPMIFVLCTTLIALVRIAKHSLATQPQDGASIANAVSSMALVLLALYIAGSAAIQVFQERRLRTQS